MDLTTSITEGTVTKVSIAVVTAIIAAAWKLCTKIYFNKPFAEPNITLTINKRAAIDTIFEVCCLITYVYLFAVAPPAENRWGVLILVGLSVGALMFAGSLMWRFAKWRVQVDKARAAEKEAA